MFLSNREVLCFPSSWRTILRTKRLISAFDVKINGDSILNSGDISTLSFHSTKLFHTVEGGAIICNDDELAEKIKLIRSFGHKGDDYYCLGINGKNSEFHAAMGHAVLPYTNEIKNTRKKNTIIITMTRTRKK